jgi:hypothetical protein
MATTVASVESTFIPGAPIEDVSIRRPHWDANWGMEEAGPDDDGEQPLRQYTRRANLGMSILLSAVQDYRGTNERDHNSAELFLYPDDEQYRRHLELVCDLTDFPLSYLRSTLDRLRPRWDAERREANNSEKERVNPNATNRAI